MKYHRVYVPGGTYFFTLVTHGRKPFFSNPDAINLLRQSFSHVIQRMPFTIVASVILPDHLHMIWSLPEQSSDYSTRWRLIKSHFTHNYCLNNDQTVNLSRVQKGEKEIWQRRFWEHLIRNENDLNRHIEYIHYNPVKHGLVHSPIDWQHSSFKRFVQEGVYSSDWGETQNIWSGNNSME